jgi:uncharacterized protein (DUF2225 family)
MGLFSKNKAPEAPAPVKQVEEVKEVVIRDEIIENEEEYIFDKTFECPLCGKSFKMKKMRINKDRVISQDTDLRNVYSKVDHYKYGALVCARCGYAALDDMFKPLAKSRKDMVVNGISVDFEGLDLPNGPYSYDDAIRIHEHINKCNDVREAKASEKAFSYLRMAWLLRGKNECTESPKAKAGLQAKEDEYITKAQEAFVEAIGNETFPMCGLDEQTVNYILADLSRKLHKFNDAFQLISRIVVSNAAPSRLKDKARDLRDIMEEDKKRLGIEE